MSNVQTVGVRLRPDLVARRVEIGSRWQWVVKDPLARRFFYFSDVEYRILELLDGRRTLAELSRHCAHQLAPQFVSPGPLIRFLADAKTKGLLVGGDEAIAADDERLAAPLAATGRGVAAPARWWHQPLAIRLPGINPDRYLDRWFSNAAARRASRWFSPLVAAIGLCALWLAGLGVALTHGEAIAAQLSTLANDFQPGWIVGLMLVIGATKVGHEAAHAAACKWLGGECRELGVMLLLGIPCLYCDVSDAWMMAQRSKRIFVSAAGMIAELSLAAVAALLWVAMIPGPWRDIALLVMVVCSINTVLINGNPLLRYDGYFMLSDLMGVPNLGGESSALIQRRLRQRLWGLATPPGEAVQTAPASLLVAYGLLSMAYRALVLTTILYAIYRFTAGHGVAVLAIVAAVGIAGRGLLVWWRGVLRPPAELLTRPLALRGRSIAIRLALASLLVFVWFVPLPKTVVAPTSIRPAAYQEVFATVTGRLVQAMAAGDRVQRGDTILLLANETLDHQLQRVETEHQSLAAELQSLRRRRFSDREAAARIPAVGSAIGAVAQQREMYRRQRASLRILAPADGVIYSSPRRSQPVDDRFAAGDLASGEDGWWGSPLDRANVGCTVASGTRVCAVGDDRAGEAVIILAQSQIALVRPAQRVTLLRTDFSHQQLAGTVSEISAVAMNAFPEELVSAGLVMPPDPSNRLQKFYQVRVELDRSVATPPLRLSGYAKIRVAPASIHQRVRRSLALALGLH